MDVRELIADPLIPVASSSPQMIYLHDYDILEKSPAYQRLTLSGRYKLSVGAILVAFHSSYVGRICLNSVFITILFFMKYFPFFSFTKFGVVKSFARPFVEDPTDDEEPKPNSEYYKPQPPLPLYKELLAMI